MNMLCQRHPCASHEQGLFLFHVLPRDVAHMLLIDWIQDILCICALEIACCNAKYMHRFHEALAGMNTSIPCRFHRSSAALQWLAQRQVTIDSSYELTVEDLPWAVSCLPVLSKVESLTLSSCLGRGTARSELRQHHWEQFFSACRQVTQITMYTTLLQDDDSFQWFMDASRHLPLTAITMATQVHASNETLLEMIVDQWGGSLTSINMSASGPYSSHILTVIQHRCPMLRKWALQPADFIANPSALFDTLSGLALTELTLERGWSVNYTHFDDSLLLAALPSMPSLQVLTMSNCTHINRHYCLVPVLFKRFVNLKALVSSGFMFAAKDGQCALMVHQPALAVLLDTALPFPVTSLIVSIEQPKATEVIALVRKVGSSLKEYSSGYAAVDGALVEAIALHCPRLTSFQLRSHCLDSDACHGLLSLADVLGHQLTSLTLHNAKDLSDQRLLGMLSNCPNLEKLELMFCALLTDESFASILEQCPRLQSLQLKYTSMTTRGVAWNLVSSSRLRRPLHIRLCRKLNIIVIKEEIAMALAGEHNPWAGKQGNGKQWLG